MKQYPLIESNYRPECVILANGEYPSHPYTLALLKQAQYVICCDGAANEYLRRGNVPNLIVGDGDSVWKEYRERYKEIFCRITEQETNDLTKAMGCAQKKGFQNVFILGATGKREDHMLGNVSLLMEYRLTVNVRMVTNYGVFIPVKGDATFDCHSGQQISIINYTATSLKGEGLAYPLRPFTNWWQGTLNEATSDHFIIQSDGSYLVYISYFDV